MQGAYPTAAVVGPSSVDPSALNILALPPARFAFPEIVEPPKRTPIESPQVAWPRCGNAQIAAACQETADAILRQFSPEAESPVRQLIRHATIGLTSPGDGDGKTSLTLSLAPHLAQRIAGGILVVDANVAKPDLTARLGAPVAPAGSAPAALDVGPSFPTRGLPQNKLLVYPTSVARLSVLPVREGRPSRGFDPSLIDELREGWPLVLLDLPSLANEAARPLVGRCSGVYLAVRLGHTPRSAVARAVRTVRRSGGRLLGCVVIR